MTFLYPIGLIGLIGIPILILVYIIKNRYTEQTVASTYLWTLSERFLKRRNPLSKITGIISLILQLLLVLVLSLSVAHPVIILPGQANEYCFVLDGSGSMNMEVDGVSRFDAAKNEINGIIDEAKDGSVFSLVYVTEITEIIFELSDNRALIKERIAALECSDGSVEYTDAIGVAQGYFNENPSLKTYLVTDADYQEHKNINVVNVARNENNMSIEDVKYTVESDGTISVVGIITSYGANRIADIEVYADGGTEPVGAYRTFAQMDTPTEFGVTFEIEEFDFLTVGFINEDAMVGDNSVTVYNLKSANAYKALLISNTPFFIENGIKQVSNADLTVKTSEEYENALNNTPDLVSGFGLYIFDAYVPETMPKDGAIWIIGPTANISGSGFSVQGEIELDDGDLLELNKSSGSLVKELTAGITGDNIYIKKYMKCGVYGNFTTLFSYMGSPIIFMGVNDFGNREVVFAFNFHDSDFALSSDHLIIFHNLLDYSFPEVVEKTEYYCGESAQINVVSGCTGIRIDAPSGKETYLDVTSAVSKFTLTEVGEYKITATVSGADRVFCIYSSVPKEERLTAVTEDNIGIVGEPKSSGRDGKYDNLTVLFIVAAILFTAEWMVYCYDKYQLR